MSRTRRPPLRRPGIVAVCLLCALLLAACGSDGAGGRPNRDADVAIAGPPGAAHVGAYLAVSRSYTDAEGVAVRLTPGSTAIEVVDALLTGKAQFGAIGLHDLATASDRGDDLVAVMALVQRPLAAVLATQDIRSPRELEGHRVALSGLPADETILDAMVTADGGDPDRVKRGPVPEAEDAFLAGEYAGLTGVWPAATARFGARVPGVRAFKADEFGVPTYPELVLVTPRTTVQDDPSLVRAMVAALQRGYREALADPESAVAAITDTVPGTDRTAIAAELDDLQPLFQASSGRVGTFDPDALGRWAAWEAKVGLVRKAPEVTQLFVPRFAAASAAKAAETSGQ